VNRLRLSILLVLLSTASAPPALALGHHHAYANKYQKTIAKRQKKEQKRQAKAIKAWRKQHNVSH
jgi:hypothetical protein